MREITEHRVNPANDTLEVLALDQPGSGGACHAYQIGGYDSSTNPSETAGVPSFASPCVILFQNGPIAEVGVNGITHEALIAILLDRLRSFQNEGFATVENNEAIEGLTKAQQALHRRTLARMARGVEGTHKK